MCMSIASHRQILHIAMIVQFYITVLQETVESATVTKCMCFVCTAHSNGPDHLVDFEIVNTEAFFFLTRTTGEADGLDCSKLQHLVDLPLHFISHRQRDSVWMLSNRKGISYVDCVLGYCGASKLASYDVWELLE